MKWVIYLLLWTQVQAPTLTYKLNSVYPLYFTSQATCEQASSWIQALKANAWNYRAMGFTMLGLADVGTPEQVGDACFQSP